MALRNVFICCGLSCGSGFLGGAICAGLCRADAGIGMSPTRIFEIEELERRSAGLMPQNHYEEFFS